MRGNHVKSYYARMQLSTPIISYTKLYSLSKLYHVPSSHISPCDKPSGRELGGPKEHWNKAKMTKSHSIIYTYATVISTSSYLSHIIDKPPPSSIWCQKPPSRHPSNLTSFYSVSALHLLLPSTLFTFSPYVQTVSMFSNSFYSPNHFQFKLFYASLHS